MSHPGTAPLLVASNRGPLSVVAVPDSDDEVRRGSGGLVSGMQAALTATPDAVWVCAAMNDRERALAREAPGGRLDQVEACSSALHGDFGVRMLPLDGLTFRNAYSGLANSTLWFVLHMMYDLPSNPVFDAAWRRQWASYVRYNQAFAQALAEEAAEGAQVVIQDYHLFLAPRMLRTLRPDLRIGHFTHTPWVPAEYLAILPEDIRYAIVDGLLGADVIGFHTERWAQLFSECCYAVVGRAVDGVQVFPLGIDDSELVARAHRRDVDAELRALHEVVGDCRVIGRVDRTELSKNAWRGLLAYREFLRTQPEWHGKVVHVVFNNPSREDLPAYREYTASLSRLATRIEEEFGTDTWTPVVLEISEDYAAALAVLRRSDVLLINSVRDGMNLVVLEALVLADNPPAVVLSTQTGAAEVLGDDALQVNPFDVSATSDALHAALLMSEAERGERAERMRAAAVALPPAEWFRAQLDALDKVSPPVR